MPATDKYLRNLNTMHVVFAATAMGLLVATVWMMAADHNDPWRDYQKTFEEIQAEKLRRAADRVKTDEHNQRVRELEQKLQQANEDLQSRGDALAQARDELKALDNEVDLLNREVRNKRAERDVARANLDLGIRDQLGEQELAALKAKFDELQAIVDGPEGLERDLQELQTARNQKAEEVAAFTAERDKIAAALKQQRSEVEQLHKALTQIEPENPLVAAKRTMMEWPIIDGFNSHLKIYQDWLPDLHVTLGMTETARFDRCRTCHRGIDQVETGNVPAFPHGDPESDDPSDWLDAGKFPHPYSTHPRTDVYLTATSPHPLSTFGCTACHEGQGSGTTFSNASHTPNDPHQEHVWHDEYGYESNHFWEYPMFPERFRESSCLKCHHTVLELGVNEKYGATAPKVYKGWQLVRQYGCFGCHEIHGFDAGKPIGPDLRLEPSTPEEAQKYAEDPNLIAGTMRKVGPSLKHIADKTTFEWIAYWTEEPKRFRPSTRMPQFFKLTNQQDPHAQRLMPVEIAGIARYLMDKSQPNELMKPRDGYQPDPERGAELFSHRGCLACHQHDQFPNATQAEFGPNLSKVHAKIKPGQDGFNWVYTWIRNPELHHPRTKMPNLFLEPEGEGDEYIDPAADIAAFLLQKGPGTYPAVQVDDAALDELVELYLSKAITEAQVDLVMSSRKYPLPPEAVKGDEIELALATEAERSNDERWRQIKLNYVGRRTISQYGCYGCHDIPGFETARPIGTALQDWGRKDASRLAPEHIEEYLHHHGEPDGSSTRDRVERALKRARAGEFSDEAERDRELAAAYFYDNLLHHGRAGFLWQKLRQPRSYDYEKIETKGYDERLRMPKFPFTEEEIEAIATFVLGLVAEPPQEHYIYQPTGAARDRLAGERLIQKFNCTGCHMTDLPEIHYAVDPAELAASELRPSDHPEAHALLMQLKPPRNALTGRTVQVEQDGETRELPVISFHGLVFANPDPEEDPEYQEYAYDLWETLEVDGKQLFPGTRLLVPAQRLIERKPAKGGAFAQWLVEDLMEGPADGNRFLAWQMAPPPLYDEGIKVQTSWLYRFLKEPGQIRHTTVLRMPRFNMSDEEARTLANYFAAVDGVPYPYQEIEPQEPEYLAEMNQTFHTSFPDKSHDYLAESWQLLNAPLCIKCHSVGGRPFQATDPQKDIRGPNLELVRDRLRPDWTLLWLFNPRWITPYTSMPAVFPRNQEQFPELFGGDPKAQTVGARDALMNYYRLMEREGKYEPAQQVAGAQEGE